MKAETVMAAAALVIGGVALAFLILTEIGEAGAEKVPLAGLEEKISRLEHNFKAYKKAHRSDLTSLEERLDQMEQDIAQLREMLEQAKKSSQKSVNKETVKPGELTPTTPPVQGPSAGPVPRPNPDKRERFLRHPFGRRMFDRLGNFSTQRLQEFAKKHNWDTAKTERVAEILKNQREQMQNLLKNLDPNTNRRSLLEQMHQIMKQTTENLKQEMTEEEFREFRRMMLPNRRFRPPFGRKHIPEGENR